jgi:hypothetical protein
LTRPLLRVVLLEIEFVGNVAVREVESHEIQAQYPHSQGLMMASKDRIRQSVKASLAGLAQVALTLGLRVIASLLGNIKTITMGARDPVWPAEGADRLKTFSIIDERL